MKEKISIIVPTYNESENIKSLIERLGKALKQHNYEILVIDDNSPDGTADIAQSLSEEYPVKIIHRPGKAGLASAVIEGIGKAEGDIVGVIDADLQHPPELVVQLARAITEGNDIAIASRYIKGGGVENWSLLRRIASKGAILLARPLTKVHDPASGYFFIDKKVVMEIVFKPAGFKILLEILVKGRYERAKEIPYVFSERREGKSKLGLMEYARYLKLLYGLYLFRLKVAFTRNSVK
jgi:dolichol-phosphate mannosyltransferase